MPFGLMGIQHFRTKSIKLDAHLSRRHSRDTWGQGAIFTEKASLYASFGAPICDRRHVQPFVFSKA
jgi:hypothetical protein